MNEDNLPYDNFNYFDRILIRIIRKYYPDLKNKKELNLLACIGETMKDSDWMVAYAPEVETRMTLNPTWEESNDYKLGHEGLPENLLLPDEYKDILSHLIRIKIVRQKMLFTTYGSPPGELLKYEEYLEFTNENMTNEILGNSEALDQARQYFVSSGVVEEINKELIKKEKMKHLCLLISILVIICLISYPTSSEKGTTNPGFRQKS
jgi:hypothetical protein